VKNCLAQKPGFSRLAQDIHGMTNHSDIKTSLSQVYPYSEEQIELFRNRLTTRMLKRKELLLRPHFITESMSFIEEGSLRLYTRTPQSEISFHFFTEGQWAADIESLLLQRPSLNYLEAMEPTTVLSISLRDLHALMDLDPAFRLLNALIANMTISTTHIVSINTNSPDERYKALLEKHPDWINRFPQHLLASFLGMTRETLSRVRARMS
jgi:CRP-like cAMP-binding protein